MYAVSHNSKQIRLNPAWTQNWIRQTTQASSQNVTKRVWWMLIGAVRLTPANYVQEIRAVRGHKPVTAHEGAHVQ